MGTQKAKTKVATSKLANPVVEESSLSSVALNGFSPSGEYFAIVHRPASSYILRVHDAATNALRSEYVVETGEISSLSWLTLPADGDSAPDSSSPSKKRKKRSNATPSSQSLIALGFADGSIELYSVEHSAVVKRFNSSENTPKSRIRAVRSRIAGKDAQIWTCSEDGQIRIWSISSLSCIHSWTPKSSSPFTTFEFRPDSQDASFIAGGSNVALYTPEIIPTSQSFSASQSQTFEGHSSPVKQLIWDLSTSPRKFISTAQTDRFLNIWEVPSPGSSNASGLLASVGLDAEVKHVATGSGHSPSERLLLATSATSKAAVFAVPSKKIGAGDALSPLVMFVSSTASVQSEILGGTFLESKAGYVRFARLIGGSKVSFTDVVSC
jgi:WD40 repeat protein